MVKGKTCSEAGRCTWYQGDYGGNEGTCGACESGKDDCVQTWTPPSYGGYDNDASYGNGGGGDSGAVCNTYKDDSIYDCPEPRCYLDYSEDSHGNAEGCGGQGSTETCRDPVCADLSWEEDVCAKLKECKYDTESGVCSDPTLPFPCKEVYDKAACTAQAAACSWKDLSSPGQDDDTGYGFCYNKGATISCDRYDEAQTCPSTCTWMKHTYKCVDKGYEPSCTEFGSEGEHSLSILILIQPNKQTNKCMIIYI